jgi:hypothetical protein
VANTAQCDTIVKVEAKVRIGGPGLNMVTMERAGACVCMITFNTMESITRIDLLNEFLPFTLLI